MILSKIGEQEKPLEEYEYKTEVDFDGEIIPVYSDIKLKGWEPNNNEENENKTTTTT